MVRIAPRRALVVYAVLVLVFVLHRIVEAGGRSPVPLRSWLDDLLAVPLVLGIALALQRWRRGRPDWTLPPGQVLLAAGFFALVFEAVLPLVSSRVTADSWDLAAYAAGAVLFQLEINRPVVPPKMCFPSE